MQIVDPDDMKLDNDNGLDEAIAQRLAQTTKHHAKLVTPNEPMIIKTSTLAQKQNMQQQRPRNKSRHKKQTNSS